MINTAQTAIDKMCILTSELSKFYTDKNAFESEIHMLILVKGKSKGK